MAILCGTDFSEHASGALAVAAELAVRMQVPVHLCHSVESAFLSLDDAARATHEAAVRKRLQVEAERLRALGARVEMSIEHGPSDEALMELAKRVGATLIVVAALGQRAPDKHLGSHAERLAQHAAVPVLVVRQSAALCSWARGDRPLRILLGADLSQSTKLAMQFVESLRKLGPCEVIATHLYWPPTQFLRLGLTGARNYLDADPDVTAVLARDLEKHLGSRDVRVRIQPHLGRIGDRLATIADEERADLVVVGSHLRSDLERFLEGSASRHLLQHAHVSVACVPALATAAAQATDLRNVLVATDFSATGDAAIRLGYAIAAPGGTVHLVHVVKDRGHYPTEPHDVLEKPEVTDAIPEHDAARQKLAERIPTGTVVPEKATRLHILESNTPAEAICQAAERLDADVVCLGTHGRSGVSKAVLGSVAQAVVAHTHRPVMLARPPRE